MSSWGYDMTENILAFFTSPYILSVFLLTGLFFSVGTCFFQCRHISLWLRYTFISLFKKEKRKSGGISPLQSLSTALAATIGTGNITGVAIALITGGPGSIFWMWVSAFLGMMTAYAENILSILYREKDKDGNYIGGAMYYIEKGLGSHSLAVLFSFFCVLASFGMGNMAQTHSVSSALDSAFHVPPFISGILCAAFVSFTVTGGLQRISKITEKTMLPMIFIYFIGSAVCLVHQRIFLFPALKQIFFSAFNFKSAASGIAGYHFAKIFSTGISRGIFSNEAGLGSSTVIHASSTTNEPVVQGMWGIFEVFLDTIIVCTITALVILTSGIYTPSGTVEGTLLVSSAYGQTFGTWGSLFITLSIVFFALATLLGWSCLGEKSAQYIWGNTAVPPYRFFYIVFSAVGAWSSLHFVWNLSDAFNLLMAIPNLAALIFLSPKILKETKTFLQKRHF